MVLGSTVILPSVRLIALFPLLEALDQESSVGQHASLWPGGNGHSIVPPHHRDRPLPFYLAVQHQGPVTHGDDIIGLLQEGQLRGSAQHWEREEEHGRSGTAEVLLHSYDDKDDDDGGKRADDKGHPQDRMEHLMMMMVVVELMMKKRTMMEVRGLLKNDNDEDENEDDNNDDTHTHIHTDTHTHTQKTLKAELTSGI